MSDRSERQQQWAVFWCSLLGPLLSGDIAPEEAGRFLAELAERKHLFPDGKWRKPSRATLWRKWKQYRQGGLEAIRRRRQSDRGQARKASAAMIDKAVALKKEQPLRSDETINQFLQQQFSRRFAKSTLYRHLKRAGATRLKLGISQQKVRGGPLAGRSHGPGLGPPAIHRRACHRGADHRSQRRRQVGAVKTLPA